MSQNFKSGDFLIFQIESGFGLLKLIGLTEGAEGPIWHLRAFNELFLDVDSAEQALSEPKTLTVSLPHVALTNRAYLATQVAIMKSSDLTEDEILTVEEWRASGDSPTDSPVRLLLGLR